MFDPAAAEPRPPLFPDEPLDPERVHEPVEVDAWDDSREIVGVVDVELSPLGPWMPFDSQGMTLVAGDRVVVATSRGLEMGRVCRASRYELRRGHDLPKVLRRVGPGDERQSRRNIERAQEAREFAERRIRDLGLAMKIVAVEILHGGSRAVFHFESEDRVDFRALVRDLSDHLRLRVDLHQVGVRDAAKMVGALGRCGQPACCARYLRAFCPVSIRMAKDQNLVLSPEKVSGVCGRLLCCLSYEHDGYRTLKAGLPKVGRRISTPAGEGEVKDVDILRRRVTVELSDGSRKTFAADDLGLPQPEGTAATAAGTARDGTPAGEEPDAEDGAAEDGERGTAGRPSFVPSVPVGVRAHGGEGSRESGPGSGEVAGGRGGPAGSAASGPSPGGRRRRRGRRRRPDLLPDAASAARRPGGAAPRVAAPSGAAAPGAVPEPAVRPTARAPSATRPAPEAAVAPGEAKRSAPAAAPPSARGTAEDFRRPEPGVAADPASPAARLAGGDAGNTPVAPAEATERSRGEGGGDKG